MQNGRTKQSTIKKTKNKKSSLGREAEKSYGLVGGKNHLINLKGISIYAESRPKKKHLFTQTKPDEQKKTEEIQLTISLNSKATSIKQRGLDLLLEAVRKQNLQGLIDKINRSVVRKCSMGFFRKIKTLRQNKQSSIFVAKHRFTLQKVLIKQIHKAQLKDEESHTKMVNEINIMKKLRHLDNVVSLLEVIENEKSVFLVMEYVREGDLVNFFSDNDIFSRPTLKVFFYKLATALAQIHSLGIIHRDLKLANILITSG